MPELPDLAILADAFQATLVGRPVEALTVTQSLVVRGTPAEATAMAGQRVEAVTRRGKFLTFQLERDRLVINAMLTGRLGLDVPGAKPLRDTAAVIRLGLREAPVRKRGGARMPPNGRAALRGCRTRGDHSSCAIGTRRGWARCI